MFFGTTRRRAEFFQGSLNIGFQSFYSDFCRAGIAGFRRQNEPPVTFLREAWKIS